MTLPDKEHWLWPDWQPHPKVCVAVTTRYGAVSPSPWHGFNLGLNTGDREDRVLRARHHVEKILQPDHPIPWLTQVHGTRVIHAAEGNREADGVWTDQTSWPCAVLTADCLPVLLARQDGSAVAAVHAGWRGLHDGIIAQAANHLAPEGQAISAWLGPAISAQHYQVGVEMYRAFTALDPAYKDAFMKDATPNHWRFSLVHAAIYQLNALGIDDVDGGTECTASDLQHFYSYRKEKDTGRFATIIWLDR